MGVAKKPVQLGRFGTWLSKRGLVIRTFAAWILIGTLGLSGYACWKVMAAAYNWLGTEGASNNYRQESIAAKPVKEIEVVRPSLLEPASKAVLNPAWRDRYGSNRIRDHFKDVPLSASGYPIIIVVKPTAVCSGPIRLQLAKDLQIAQRLQDVEKMEDCAILSVGMRAEWIDPNPFDNETVALRLHPSGALPFTVYGPDPNGGGSPFYAWFGTIARTGPASGQ